MSKEKDKNGGSRDRGRRDRDDRRDRRRSIREREARYEREDDDFEDEFDFDDDDGRVGIRRRSEMGRASRESYAEVIREIRDFLADRGEVMHDERRRLREALERAEREEERTPVENELPEELVGTGYEDMDREDLLVMRSIHTAAAREFGREQTREWGDRLRAALESTAGGRGDELVATGLGGRLWEDVHVATRVGSLFPTVNMPTNPFEVPAGLGDVTWEPGVEVTAPAESTPGTGKRTLTAYEIVARVPWSLTLDEDSVIAMMPELRRSLTRQASEVIDDVLLNGDTTAANNINSDGVNAVPADRKVVTLGFDGLLHFGLIDHPAQSVAAGAPLALTHFTAQLKKVGKYGLSLTDFVWITDVHGFAQMLAIPELVTVDKFGPGAAVLTGQIGSIYGHPVIVSGEMQSADADGKVTSGGNTAETSRLVGVNTSMWRVGYRRRMLVETDRDVERRRLVMVVSMRIAFTEQTGNKATATHTALTFNLAD